jgi:hypothetical protein
MTLRGRLAAVLAAFALALAVAACSTPVAAPTGTPAAVTRAATSLPPAAEPAATRGAAAPAASSSPSPASTPLAGSPAALPMLVAQHAPTIDRQAAVYLDAASTLNQARARAFEAWKGSEQTLPDGKRLAEAYAQADTAFIRRIEPIGWQGDPESIARRLVVSETEMREAAEAAAEAATWAEFHASMADMTEAAALSVAASNQLRLVLEAPACSNVLGVPAVPAK